MDWKKIPNVAMYKKADWKGLIKQEANCTVERAKQIAEADPNIAFFFICRQGMYLEGINKSFKPGDAVFFSGAPWYGSAPQCDAYEKDLVRRKNQKSMTAAEWQAFKQAIKSLKDAPTSATSPNYQQFVDCHVQAMTQHHEWGAHGGINFLTWHRDYLQHFEARLRSFNPAVFIPYWNWVEDRAIPTAMSSTTDLTSWGVTRNPSPDFRGVANAANLTTLMGQTTFNAFTGMVEASPFHNLVHVVVGGPTGAMSGAASPSDPIFWLHHCFIDKLFADWQNGHKTIAHPNKDLLLQPAPFITRTNAQVWDILNLGYSYV
jgi:hypothetical protein